MRQKLGAQQADIILWEIQSKKTHQSSSTAQYIHFKVIGVAASAAEAELGSLFLNAQEAVKLWIALDEMGHRQPPTPIHCDNTTTTGIVHGTIKQHRS